jgi:cob(I)alamin adenosyltransferase
MGTVDELSSTLGVCIDFCDANATKEELRNVQYNLYIVGSLLCGSKHDPVTWNVEEEITQLEHMIDMISDGTSMPSKFILPGGNGRYVDSFLHVSRSVCRRAERMIVAIDDVFFSACIVPYMNRLSDYLFVLSLVVNDDAKHHS